nr:12463_t:CDS:2 [Entrophospora candida]
MSNRLTLDEAIRIVEEWGGYEYKLTFENAIQLASIKNGKCLSTEYKNNKSTFMAMRKLHTWQTSFNVIKYQNTWCPYYVRDKRKLTLEDAKQFAFNKCLSTKYKNSKNLLLWAIGYWRPYCKTNLCHENVTKYLGLPSKICRPNFLKTSKYPTGLELDIYYPQYGFAIEVQGEQHEKYIEFFHRDPIDFIRQRKQDKLKKELYEENWPVESNGASIRNNYKRSHIIEAHFKTIIKLRDLLEIEPEPMLSVITNNNNSFNGNDKFKTVKSHVIKNQGAILSEYQDRITIGCDPAANLQINDPNTMESN